MSQPKAVETSPGALTTSELAMRFWRNRKHVVSASTGDDLVLMVDAISFANECRQARLSPEAIQQQVKPGHPIAIPTETNPTPEAIERAAWRISLLFAERLHQSKSNTEFLQEILREELGVKI